ncbi:hypothetical protein MNBD_GAMMA10-1463 [hydrothermal vent metagenome]|uniref:Mobile element protein n=1 Tax=hydrothermal vent metagenome TaxID=652676 RepID=A0A3B0XN25_9ZZZZ
MPKPRYAQVSLEATPWYHCYSRCVHRAFLCGLGGLTETSYEHRKQWLEDRVYTASAAFALDLCTYRHHVKPLSCSTACKQASGRCMGHGRDNKPVAYAIQRQ